MAFYLIGWFLFTHRLNRFWTPAIVLVAWLIVGLVLTTSEAAWPISVALAQALNPITEPSWGLLNSAGLIAALVPAVLAFVLRGAVMRGMLSGALKG